MSKLHPRERKVADAKLRLMALLVELQEDLTEGEFLRVVTEELSGRWSSAVKFMIRQERHPDDPDKPGGLE